MKELTIKEKAKAYDEAVKEASIAYKDEDRHLKAVLKRIFPELIESEDEKIRKELIKMVNYFYGSSLNCQHYVSQEDILAWLEKQGKKSMDIDIPFGAYDSELIEETYDIPKDYYVVIKDNKIIIRKNL